MCIPGSEDAYTALREILQERLNDREPLVRVQTVIALSKLCGSEDPSDETTITDMLIDTLTYDTSAYVSLFDVTGLLTSGLQRCPSSRIGQPAH